LNIAASPAHGRDGTLCASHQPPTTDESGVVQLTACNYNDSRQWWFVDGDELMGSSGQCLDEIGNGDTRATTSCDGITYQTNVNSKDDQFLVTPAGGTYVPDTVANWKNNVSVYEHA
jgi:hypothetical protein